MVSPRDSLDAVVRSVANSGELPREMSVLTHEADQDQQDADIDLPLLEVLLLEADDVVVSNTDLIGWITDGNGNRIGRRYFSEYEMTLQLNIWTGVGGGYDPDDLGEKLRNALYTHSSYGPAEPFLDESGSPIDAISYFDIVMGERVDDLLQTPTVRRWRQEVELWAHEEFRTEEDYIVDVNYPQDGDFGDSSDPGTIDTDSAIR